MAVKGFNIDDFKSNYQDLSRQYLFMIMVNFPGVAGAQFNADNTKYLISSSSMPTSTITEAEVNWQGMIYPLGTTQEFEDWTVTFRLDSAAQLRRDFLNWHRAIHNPVTNVHGSPPDYMADQEIWLLDTQGNIVMQMRLVSAWPTSIGELTLDYSAKEISTFDVTWKYVYHEEV